MNRILVSAACAIILLPASTVFADGSEQVKMTKATIIELSRALDMYYADCGQYPTELTYLVKPSTTCQKRKHSYIKEIKPDAWGHPLQYNRPDSKNFHLRSFGADGVEGGDQENTDIAN
jgi:general secretion pathway protein G